MKPLFFEQTPIEIALQTVREARIVEQLQVEASQNSRRPHGAGPIAAVVAGFKEAQGRLQVQNLRALWSIAELRGTTWVETTFDNELLHISPYNALLGFVVIGEPETYFTIKKEESQEKNNELKKPNSRREQLKQQSSRKYLKELTDDSGQFDDLHFSWAIRSSGRILGERIAYIYDNVQAAEHLDLNLDPINPFILIAGGYTLRESSVPRGNFPRAIQVPLSLEAAKALKNVKPVDASTIAIARARETWTFSHGNWFYFRPDPERLREAFNIFERPVIDLGLLGHNTNINDILTRRALTGWLSDLYRIKEINAAILEIVPGKAVRGGISNFHTGLNGIEYSNLETDSRETDYAFP